MGLHGAGGTIGIVFTPVVSLAVGLIFGWRISFVVFLVCAALLLPLADQLVAQEARGTIVGRVFDPSGAAVPGANVVVTNKAMGTKTTVSSNEAGGLGLGGTPMVRAFFGEL